MSELHKRKPRGFLLTRNLFISPEVAEPPDDWNPEHSVADFVTWAREGCQDVNDLSFFVSYLGWEGDDFTPEDIAAILEAFQLNPMVPLLALEDPEAALYVEGVYEWAADTMAKQGLFLFEVSL